MKMTTNCDHHNPPRVYTVFDIIRAEYTLEPLVCLYCAQAGHVDYQQSVADGYCSFCDRWQLENTSLANFVFEDLEINDTIMDGRGVYKVSAITPAHKPNDPECPYQGGHERYITVSGSGWVCRKLFDEDLPNFKRIVKE